MLDVESLATYLDDHLAGAGAALELIERLRLDPQDGLDLESLYREIDEERQLLVALREKLSSKGPLKGLKRAASWVAERLSRPKLVDDTGLGRFEALEVLGLGILGKRAMWRALATLRDDDPRLAAVAFDTLEARGREQHRRVERARLASAQRAFTADAAR